MDDITEKSDEINDALVDRLIESRKAKGLSRSALAEACNIPPSTLADYETKRQVFPMNRAIRVAIYLEVDIFNPLKQATTENEEVQISINPENIQDFFMMLLKNDTSLKSEMTELKSLMHEVLKEVKKEDTPADSSE
jgi:transcriptional regulator with XRE-family HTH domain